MIATLEVAFADVSAGALGWALGLPPRPALAHLLLDQPGGIQVQLRLLGASHQVLVHAGGSLLCSETVACDLPDADPLPARSTAIDGYSFRSDVQHLGTAAYTTTIERLKAETIGRPDVLVGQFPGVPHAVTVLAADTPTAGETSWRTWHGYPQTGELVSTRTRLTHPEVVR